MISVHATKIICQSGMLFWVRTNLVQKKSGFEAQKVGATAEHDVFMLQ